MKRAVFLIMLLFAVSFVISCGESKPVLRLFIWGEYISPEVVSDFEKEFGCVVKIDLFDSNEAMYAKLKAGADGYDIIVPSSYTAAMMNKQNMLQKLDHSLLPNVIEYFDKSYSSLLLDHDFEYTVPYFISFTGIGYNTERVKNFEPTWEMFKKNDLGSRCSLLNDMREVIGAALLTLGYSPNTVKPEEIDEAVELALQWKKNIAKFEVDDAQRALASGEFLMIQTFSGDMLQVIAEKPEIAFVIPREGTTSTLDNFQIMANSTNQELAHAFINYMYRPEVSVQNMNEIMYMAPHKEAVKLVNESLRNNSAFMVSEDVKAKCIPLLDLDQDNALYIKAWERIRAE